VRGIGGAGIENTTMERQKILLPVDIARCPLGIFDVINRFARSSPMTVILLHVVTLNIIGAENRIYEELGRDAHWYLEKLASSYLRPNIPTLLRVRRGKIAEQILAQARADQLDLIVLPVDHPLLENGASVSSSNRPPVTVSPLARTIIRGASCDVLVIPFNKCLDCEKAWGRPTIPGGSDESVLLRVALPLTPHSRV